MSELIKCKTCGGIVSSAASQCPHCGEPAFKSDAYLAEEFRKSQQIAAQQEQARLAELERKNGRSLEVYARGEVPKGWFRRIRIAENRYSQYSSYSTLWYDNDRAEYEITAPATVRLRPGTYQAYYSEIVVSSGGFYEDGSIATFMITSTSSKLFLNFEKKFLSKHHKLTFVTVTDR